MHQIRVRHITVSSTPVQYMCYQPQRTILSNAAIKKIDQSQSKLHHIRLKNVNRHRLMPYYKITNGNPTNNDDKKSEDTT